MSRFDALVASYGPSAWWKLNDPVGSATAADSSGNDYTGTPHGGVTFGQPGPIAGQTAAAFDGSTGYIEAIPESALEGSFTIACWFNVPSSPSGKSLFEGDYTSSSPDVTSLHLYPNVINVNVGSAGGLIGPNLNMAATISANVWYFLAVTVIPGTAGYFLNGASLGTLGFGAGTPQLWVAGKGVSISSSLAVLAFSGSIAEVAIFPYALSAAQIAALWSPPPLVSGGSGFPQLVYR